MVCDLTLTFMLSGVTYGLWYLNWTMVNETLFELVCLTLRLNSWILVGCLKQYLDLCIEQLFLGVTIKCRSSLVALPDVEAEMNVVWWLDLIFHVAWGSEIQIQCTNNRHHFVQMVWTLKDKMGPDLWWRLWEAMWACSLIFAPCLVQWMGFG